MNNAHTYYTLETLEETMKRETRARRISLFKTTGNKALESIGETFRGVLTLPESKNPDTNRRAGRTALIAGVLVLGALVKANQMTEPAPCRTFGQSEFVTEDLTVLAAEITEKTDAYTAGDSLVFDAAQEQLFEEGSVTICGANNINSVASLTNN